LIIVIYYRVHLPFTAMNRTSFSHCTKHVEQTVGERKKKPENTEN